MTETTPQWKIEFIPEDRFWRAVFLKSLFLFVLAKLLWNWPWIKTIIRHTEYEPKSIWSSLVFTPLHLIKVHPDFYVYTFLLILIVSLFVRVNYLMAWLVCWFSASLSRLMYPVFNGTDLILNLFLVIGILMPLISSTQYRLVKEYTGLISDFSVLLIRVEIALIYLLSGYDKLISESWRTGSAIFSVMKLDFFINPIVSGPIPNWALLVIAWMVIIFELLFPLLIWFVRVRKYVLLTGVLFHGLIIVFLGLIDFGVLMILSYIIFFPVNSNRSNVSRINSNIIPAGL